MFILANSIRPEPSFVGSSLKNITVPEGRDVVLSCTVKNLDGHKVAWIHYDRSAILTVDKTVITRNARIGVSHEGKSSQYNLYSGATELVLNSGTRGPGTGSFSGTQTSDVTGFKKLGAGQFRF